MNSASPRHAPLRRPPTCVFVLAIGLLACNRTTDDSTKSAVKIGPPRRIVSLSPALTEVLFAVGCGDKLVARDGWSDYPAAALRLPKLAGLVPPVEAIVATNPDLVLSHFPPQRLRAGLEAAHIPWLGLGPQRLDEVADTFVAVAERCGAAQAGTRLAQGWRQAVAAVKAATHDGPHPTVFLELDPGQGRPHTVGRGTFLNDVIEAAGGRNVMADAGRWLQVSAEQVLTAAPEVILLTVRPEEAAARIAALKRRPGWSALPAVRHNRIFAIHPDLLSRPGPRLIFGLRAVAGHLSTVSLPALPATLTPILRP